MENNEFGEMGYLMGIENSKAIASIENRKIYSVFWNMSSDPVLTRLDDAIGAEVNVGVDDNYALNTADFWSIFKDWEEVTDDYGNVFVRATKTYLKKTVIHGIMIWGASRFKHDDSWYRPWCFWDFENNKELDYVDIGKYNANLSDDSTKIESKTGKFPLFNKNIVDFRNYAQANGAGYQQLDIHVMDLLQTLFVIETATLNSQSVIAGFTSGQLSSSHLATVAESGVNRVIIANSYADQYRVGQTIGIGTSQGGNQIAYNRIITSIDVYDASNKAITFDGDAVDIAVGNMVYNLAYQSGVCDDVVASIGSPFSTSDGKYPFTWHGIENIFGNIWQWCDGININDYQAWVAKDADEYISNMFTEPYEQLGYVDASENGYTIEMGYDEDLPFANFPKTLGGGSTTYYSDYYYQASGQCVARVGGPWYSGSDAGLFSWSLYFSSSLANVSVGGRLVKKPL